MKKCMAKLRRSRSFWLSASFLFFVFSGALLSFGLDDLDEASRMKVLERRLPAEVEYYRIIEEFINQRHAMEMENKGVPNLLENGRKKIHKEEKKLLQHVMDKHGFINEFAFLDFQSQKGDQALKKELMEKHPKEFRQAKIYRLQTLIESSKPGIKALEAKGAKTVEIVRQELKQYEGELALLIRENAQWQFPWPKSEEKAFSEISLAWWDLKKTFLEQYDALSTASPSYPRDRWDLTQAYRTTLRELMRSHRVQPAHIDEYYQRTPRFLKSYLQQHAQQREQAKKIQTSLKEFGHALSFDQAEGMGLIIGTVIQRADLTEKGKGDNRQQRVPVAEIPIELVTEGETTIKHQGFYRRTTSNAQGQFAIPAVPPGDYYLSIRLVQKEKAVMYRAPIREFFIEGNHEVLILDMLVEKVKVSFRSVAPSDENP